ncbi:MAG: histidinol-phosphate transaminase [Gammaproteobacteria bacterium RIFCSPHIGHO2_12_FULL_37_14]|nr:MAG: histidinol-phosphate transaminase [Gammaproteobacteria bacterium RIFCSPHIGHO2_12_FULL_37_14]
MTDFRLLANQGVRNLTPYQPGKPIEEVERELGITSIIKLASNENPLGPSPKAIASAKQALLTAHIYPDGNCYEFKHILSSFLAIKPEQITVGNGSENLLELIVKSYLNCNDEVIISQYAFLTIPIIIKSYNIKMIIAPAVNWGHHIKNIIDAVNEKTKMIFLVNPNNPTGTYTNKNDFLLLMKSIPPGVIVVSDEAYAEYILRDDYPKTLDYLANYPNLIITRTFSKAYGLAALRFGYAISSPEIADILNRARLPFNVNTIAAKAACAALSDQEHVQKTLLLNTQGMQQIEFGLKKLGLTFIPSIANFITINVSNAIAIYQQLLCEGVIVRPLHAYDMPQYIRVTIGTEQQNARFLTTIEKILAVSA